MKTVQSNVSINMLLFSLCLALQKEMIKCRGRAVKSTKFNSGVSDKAECGFESPAMTLVSLSKTLNHCFVLRMGR